VKNSNPTMEELIMKEQVREERKQARTCHH